MGKQKSGPGAVEMVKRTTTAVGRQQSNLYNIEGLRLHERALRAGLTFELTLIADSLLQHPDERSAAMLAALPAASKQLTTLPDAQMTQLTNGRGLGNMISLLPIPTSRPLPTDLNSLPNPTLLVAANIVDPGNVGAMIRTGHAHGIDGFIVTGVSDPYHPKAVRTSMGSLFKTAVYPYESIDTLLTDLHHLHIQTIGTALAENANSLPETQFSQTGTAVFMGNEYHGLPEDIMSKLNLLVKIPMVNGIDSLSVNAATAVILYEIQRQKR